MTWSPELIAILALQVAVAGFLWSLHRDVRGLDRDLRRDVGDLRERMARLEGLFEGFARRPESGDV